MQHEEGEIWKRSGAFALDVVHLVGGFPDNTIGWVLGKQLLRSGTSVGANYREARRARSTAEFISKSQIALQEAEETRYWIELLLHSSIVDENRLRPLLKDIKEIAAMLTAAVKTSKRRSRRT